MADRHAVVIGGSIAGLCAARVLADVFDRVTVLDRDAFPTGAVPRAGAPQGRHVHALLVRGRRELERLFPGFDAAMAAGGAHDLDFAGDFAMLRPDGWGPRVRTGLVTLYASRTLTESVVRALLRDQQARVTVRERTDVRALLGAADPIRIRGVRMVPRDGGPAEDLAADLVVDASGRTSHAAEWLRALGVAPPADTVVEPDAAYATRWYQAPPLERWPAAWWWKGVWIDPVVPHHPTAAVLFPVEGGRWIVTVAGLGGHYPPGDDEGFTAALDRLRSPIIADAVRLATPLSPVYGHRQMANRFRHYERWAAPAGFAAIGDAACAFNPVYGQGMTSAAVCAGILGEALAATGPAHPELPRRFFAAQARFLRDPWSLATGADFRFGHTVGRRPPLAGVVNRYLDALFSIATGDPVLLRRVGEVINLLRPPRDLFAPDVAPFVAVGALRRALRPAAVLHEVPTMPAA